MFAHLDITHPDIIIVIISIIIIYIYIFMFVTQGPISGYAQRFWL